MMGTRLQVGSDEFGTVIANTRAKAEAEHQGHLRRMKEYEDAHEVDQRYVNLLWDEGYIRKANISEYREWLRLYISLGNAPTHSYDYPFSRIGMVVAIRHFPLRPLYGAMSLEIIVPSDIQVRTPDGLGHCNLFCSDGTTRGGFVPIYCDI